MPMPELTFTHHFIDNWRERVGGEPLPGTVRHIIQTSVRIQKSVYVRKDGDPWRVLAIYWHPDLDLVIKLDPIDNVAVTVMSRACWRYDGKPAAADKPVAGVDYDTPRAPAGGQPVISIRRQKSHEMAARALRISERFSERKGVAR